MFGGGLGVDGFGGVPPMLWCAEKGLSQVYDCGFLEAKSLASEDSRRVLFLGKFFDINRPIFYDFFLGSCRWGKMVA